MSLVYSLQSSTWVYTQASWILSLPFSSESCVVVCPWSSPWVASLVEKIVCIPGLCRHSSSDSTQWVDHYAHTWSPNVCLKWFPWLGWWRKIIHILVLCRRSSDLTWLVVVSHTLARAQMPTSSLSMTWLDTNCSHMWYCINDLTSLVTWLGWQNLATKFWKPDTKMCNVDT